MPVFYRWILAAAAVAVLLVILIVNTVRLGKARGRHVRDRVAPQALEARAGESLAEMLRFRTVTRAASEACDYEPYLQLQAYLERRYPAVHRVMGRETVGRYSLLYHWKPNASKTKGPAGLPVLLCAHLDVMPAGSGWDRDPFAVEINGGYVSGCGAATGKGRLTCLLEAAEILCGEGFAPRRDVYIAVSHDFESGGGEGAAAIAALLSERGLKFDMVLDGGLPICKAGLELTQEAALIGICEKGQLRLSLRAGSRGGPVSMPPRSTAAGQIAEAACRIEFRQKRAEMGPVVLRMLQKLAPMMPLMDRVMVANLWLFRPFLAARMAKSRYVNAMMRTTSSVADMQCDAVYGSLPRQSELIVDVRTLQEDTCADMTEYICKLVADLDVDVRVLEQTEATSISAVRGEAYHALSRALHAVYGDITVVPCMIPGRTDARWYEPLSACILRFSPVVITPSELKRIYRANESVKTASLGQSVLFYAEFLRSLGLHGRSEK